MKKKSLLTVIFLLLLSGCINKKDDAEDRSGSWKNLTINEKIIGYSTKDTSHPYELNPFDTSMIIRYFFDSESENNTEIETNVVNTYTQEIIRLHKLFDRHYYYFDDNGNLINNLKVINDSYGSNKEIIVEKELFDLIKFAMSTYDLTNGMFNIFTGSLTDYWEEKFSASNNYEELNTYDPYFNDDAKNTLEEVVKSIPNTKELYNSQITLNEENYSIKFNKLGNYTYIPYISLGGVAKGYATDLVKDKLKELNYTDGILYSGGSSLSSLSKPIYSTSSKGQEIQVLNPNTYNESAFKFYISDEFYFSTSGNYTTNKNYKFLDSDGNVIYRHHIINPFTGYPESYYRSVTLISYNLSNAYLDVLSTTLMNLSKEDGLNIQKSLQSNNNSLDVLYLEQQGYGSNAVLSIYSTSNVNNTLESNEKITINYVK